MKDNKDMELAKQITDTHGIAITRMLFASIALDMGKKEEVIKYLKNFE